MCLMLSKLLIPLTWKSCSTLCDHLKEAGAHVQSNCYVTPEADHILNTTATQVCRYTFEHCTICLTLQFVFFRDVDRKITLRLSPIPTWPFIASPVFLRGPNTTCYLALNDSSAVLNPGEPLAVSTAFSHRHRWRGEAMHIWRQLFIFRDALRWWSVAVHPRAACLLLVVCFFFVLLIV